MKKITTLIIALSASWLWAGQNTHLHKSFELYGDMQAALANDQFDEAKTTANALSKQLDTLSSTHLDDDADAGWKMHGNAVKVAAKTATHAKDMSELRASFKNLSDAMIALSGMTGRMDYQQYHCPMAFANKGADWLQKEGKTMNPFFGKSMQQCGSPVMSKQKEHGEHAHHDHKH